MMSSILTRKAPPLEERLREILEKEYGISDEGTYQALLKLVKGWLKPSVPGEGISLTKDGSYTLIAKEYGEPYHSLTAGAIGECIEKFLKPSGLLERAEGSKIIKAVDVGFGLGYNVAVMLKHLRDVKKDIAIEVISFEKELPKEVPPPPDSYLPYWKLLWDNLPSFEKDGISFRLLLGDARERVREVEGFDADAIFHDGFSPYKNPELWTLDFLALLTKLLKRDGVWVSYTSSLAVRKALKLLGFNLQGTSPVGRKRGGTKAGFEIEESLPEEEARKLKNSPFAVPFRDPTLNRDPLHILIDYGLSVLYNKSKS
jgi:tRNA U34 5-methylaminomethyl-2-thiouridine-forming methyltransferase MnmC